MRKGSGMRPEKRIIQLMLRSRLFRDFSATELLEKFPQLETELKYVEPGEILIETDEPVRRIGMVVSGLIMLYRSGESERIHELSQRAPDDIFGLTALFSGPGKSPVTVAAAKESQVLWFNIRPLLEDVRYKDRLKDAAMLLLANHSVRNILRLDVLQSPTMRERIMTYFKTVQDKYGSNLFQIKLTQTELADYLGVNRSALSRELNKMQREGILEILPNRRYHIMKWKKDLTDTQLGEVEHAQTNIDGKELRW